MASEWVCNGLESASANIPQTSNGWIECRRRIQFANFKRDFGRRKYFRLPIGRFIGSTGDFIAARKIDCVGPSTTTEVSKSRRRNWGRGWSTGNYYLPIVRWKTGPRIGMGPCERFRGTIRGAANSSRPNECGGEWKSFRCLESNKV